MSLCPVDLRECPDDICHGAGCIRSNGEPMIEVCDTCHDLIDPDTDRCSCDADEIDYFDDWTEDGHT